MGDEYSYKTQSNTPIKLHHKVQDKTMNKDDNYVNMNIDATLYPIEAVTKTSRKFVENFNIEFFGKEGSIEILFSLKKKNKLTLEDVKKDFMNELVHQTVRYNIFIQTKTIREMIIGRALYQTCIHYKASNE